MRGEEREPTAHKWESYILKAIGNAFSPTERDHLPEPLAAPRPEHRATAEELARGMEAF
jgi:hypothetical protein